MVIAAVAVGLIAVIGASFARYQANQQEQQQQVLQQQVEADKHKLQLLDVNMIHTSGEIFTLHYVLSGRVVNGGQFAHGPVILRIMITADPGGNTLYQTTTSPEPSIIQPGQEAPFSTQFSWMTWAVTRAILVTM